MQTFHAARPSEPQLRVVFDDAALSFGFASRTTLADVASWVEDVARIHHGAPLAIDITRADIAVARFAKHDEAAAAAVKTPAKYGVGMTLE